MLFHTSPIALDHGWEEEAVAPLLKLLTAGQQGGAWRLEDCRFTAVFLYSGMHGVIDDALTGEPPKDISLLGKEIENICAAALGL